MKGERMGCTGGAGRNRLARQQSEPEIRDLVSGECLLVQILGNPISPATVLGSVTCRGRSWVSVAARSSRVSWHWLSWKEKLNKGTVEDLREAALILQARGSVSEILAQICEASWQRKILGFLCYSPLPLWLPLSFIRGVKPLKRKKKTTGQLISLPHGEGVVCVSTAGRHACVLQLWDSSGFFILAGIHTGLYMKAVHLSIRKRVCRAEPSTNARRDPSIFSPVLSAAHPPPHQHNSLN